VRKSVDEGRGDHCGCPYLATARPVRQLAVPPQGRRGGRRLRPPCGHVTSAHPPFVCMWKDKSGITSLRLCFPQEQLKRSHCATRLCPCGFRFRRVVAMHEASPSRPFEPFRRARPGAFAAMQPTAPIRHGRSPARSSASASLCSAARACIGDCKTRFP
jgi:hypothetical protein